jgi:hypothetical protein
LELRPACGKVPTKKTKRASGHTLDTPGSLKGENSFSRKIWMRLHFQ